MGLGGMIMNLRRPKYPHNLNRDDVLMAYRMGYRDARHDAAEIALKADACIDALRTLDERLRECSRLGLTAAEAYDSFYQETVDEALHGLDSVLLVSG